MARELLGLDLATMPRKSLRWVRKSKKFSILTIGSDLNAKSMSEEMFVQSVMDWLSRSKWKAKTLLRPLSLDFEDAKHNCAVDDCIACLELIDPDKLAELAKEHWVKRHWSA